MTFNRCPSTLATPLSFLYPGKVRVDLTFTDLVRNAHYYLILFSLLRTPALERLIAREFVPDELPSLVEETFSCKDIDVTIRCLPGDGAQTFIDVMDEVRYTACCREFTQWNQH